MSHSRHLPQPATLDLPLADLRRRANRIFSESTGGGASPLWRARARGARAPSRCANADTARRCTSESGRSPACRRGDCRSGLSGGSPYTTTTLCLAPGDALLLYTMASANPRSRDNEFGVEGITRAVLSRRTRRPFEIVQGSLDDLAAFRAGTRAATPDAARPARAQWKPAARAAPRGPVSAADCWIAGTAEPGCGTAGPDAPTKKGDERKLATPLRPPGGQAERCASF